MNFADARATLRKMAKGEYHTLTVSIWPARLDWKSDYQVYISGYGFGKGRSWKQAFDKLRLKMVGKDG